MALPVVFANSPNPGYIRWDAFSISYGAENFSIPAGNTPERWVWWRWNGGGAASVIEAGSDVPADLTEDDLVILGNKNGIPVRVQSSTFIDGELLVDGSVVSKALAADAVTTQHLLANDVLITGLLTVKETVAEAVTTNGLFVGPNISLTIDGGFEIETTRGKSQFPSDGSDIALNARVTAAELTVLGSLAIRGTDNEISKNASVTLETGVTAPKVSPTISAEYDLHESHQGFNPRSLVYHAASGRYLYTESLGSGVITELNFESGTTGNYAWSWNYSLSSQRSEINSAIGGVAVVGSDIYVLCSTTETWPGSYTGRYYVYKFTYTPGTGTRWTYATRFPYLSPSLTTSLSSASDYHPSIMYSPTDNRLYIMQSQKTTGNVYYCKFEMNGTLVGSAVLIKKTGSSDPLSIKAHCTGFTDFGETDGSGTGVNSLFWVTFAGVGKVHCFDPFINQDISNSYGFPTYSTDNLGLIYDQGRFKTLSTSSITHYSRIANSDLTTSPINATQTWRRANGVSPAFAAAETVMGQQSRANTFPKRAWLRIESPTPIPDDTGDASDADSLTFYVARGSGTLTRTSYRRAATPAVGATTALFDTIPTSGANPPSAAFGFAAGTPAALKSASSDVGGALINLQGDGSWRLGYLAGTSDGKNANDSGWLALPFLNGWEDYGGGVYRPGQYRKIDNMVILRGLIKDIGTHAAGDSMFQLPVGFRPSMSEIFTVITNSITSGGASPNTSGAPDDNVTTSTSSHTHNMKNHSHSIAHTHATSNVGVRMQINADGNAYLPSTSIATGFISLSGLCFFVD